MRWRNLDRSSMGVALWEELIASPTTPISLVGDLHALEAQRIVLNMQISLCHTIARQATDCASKMAMAQAIYQGRVPHAAHAGLEQSRPLS